MSESSFDLELDDIDEGTSVASIAHTNTILLSTAPRQVTLSDDSHSIVVGDSVLDTIEKTKSEKKAVVFEKRERSIDVESMSSLGRLPVVSRQTVKSETYDLDYLLDDHVQRSARGEHRFAMSRSPSTPSVPSKNFISWNKSQARLFGPKKHVESFNLFSSTQSHRTLDVKERFWDKAAKTQEKVTAQRAEKELEEMQYCTFSPKTNISPYNRRTISEFADSVNEFIALKKSKIDAMRDKQNLSATVDTRAFTPEICSKSREIVGRRGLSMSSVYDRLHQRKRSLLQMKIERHLESEVFSYSPQINRKSAVLQRNHSVGELLYNDAIRRLNTIPEEPKRSLNYMAKKSETLLLRRLVTEFEEASIEFDSERLNYTQTKELMEKLKFISESNSATLVDMWKELKGDDKNSLPKPVLLQFLGAVIGIKVPQRYTEELPKITKQQRDAWHYQFIDFYQHRAIQVPAENKLADKFKRPVFTPELDSHSRKLQARVYESRRKRCDGKSIGDFLNHEKEKLIGELEILRREKERDEVSECTFKPLLVARPSTSMGISENRGEALFKYSKEQKETRSNKRKAAEADKRLKETEGCTFKPVINLTIAKPSEVLPSQVQTIKRLQSAREERYEKERLKEKGMTPRAYRLSLKTSIDPKPKQEGSFTKRASKNFLKNRGSVKSQTSTNVSNTSTRMTSATHSRKTSNAPSSLISRKSSAFLQSPTEEVLISLKVNISPTLSDTITIVEGEDANQAIDAFIAKHKLEPSASLKLKRHVEMQLASV